MTLALGDDLDLYLGIKSYDSEKAPIINYLF